MALKWNGNLNRYKNLYRSRVKHLRQLYSGIALQIQPKYCAPNVTLEPPRGLTCMKMLIIPIRDVNQGFCTYSRSSGRNTTIFTRQRPVSFRV